MKLGLSVGYWGAGPPAGVTEQVAAAERLGFDSMWTAEAYGSDALTPLAWWGSATTRLRLGTSIMQLSARTPTAAAMAAMSLDHLTGGRFIMGIGASGPQVVEGWYGQSYPKPLARTREYLSIVREVIAREKPVSFAGEHYQLPFPGGAGLGKPLKSTIHPYRTDLPIYLAAEGPKNVAMAAEIADGWLPLWFSPKDDERYRVNLGEGFARTGARHHAAPGDPSPVDSGAFEVAAILPTVIDDDVEAAANQIRPMLALYIGGMGAKGANFHYDVFARMGWEEQCEKIQELYLAGRKDEAIASIPLELVEDVAWVGPIDKLRDELPRWEASCLTTALVSGPPPVLEQLADLCG